ncbi:M23 family metallopeptidase [Thiocystis violacea]|uniref:M23 family metallopeptidase n=1 Tax=Thiocystis violacea TaxID=13725 RepID=UPI0030B8D56A
MFLAVLAFSLAGAGLGFWIGHYSSSPDLANISLDRPSVNRSLAREVGQSSLPREVDAMVARLGEMQAQLMRLNALGERLVQMSGLNPEEFDFENPPPQGGPETGVARDYSIKELADELSSFVGFIQDRQRKLDVIEGHIMERELTAQALPAGWPVRSGYITSNYGFRIHPVKKARLFHAGVDFGSPRGTPIHAVADGVVSFVGRKGGYGNLVDIRHMDGLVTRYAHNTSNLVKKGQMVRQGQKIATVGSTGTATGPHVHFEVIKDGRSVNPMSYLRAMPTRRLASTDADLNG